MITIERPLRPETASVGRGTHGSPDIPIQSYSSAPATLLSGRLLCCAVLPCQCHPSPPARPAACPFRWHRKLKETEEWWHDKPPASLTPLCVRACLPHACRVACEAVWSSSSVIWWGGRPQGYITATACLPHALGMASREDYRFGGGGVLRSIP
jgi:hypothetical protein